MRPLALGRKNWMCAGNPQAGVRAARIASIMETCRRLEIDPEEYLREVLAAIAGGLPANRMAEKDAGALEGRPERKERRLRAAVAPEPGPLPVFPRPGAQGPGSGVYSGATIPLHCCLIP